MNDDWWSLPFGFLIFTSIHYPLLKVAHPFLVDLTLSQDILSLSLSLPCFWNPIWQYTRYTRVGARNMIWHAFFLWCALWIVVPLFQWILISFFSRCPMIGRTILTHIRFFVWKLTCGPKTIHPTARHFQSFFFLPPVFGVVVVHIYIYRSCHGDRGLPGTRYITSIIIQRSQVWDLLTGGGNRSGWGA